MTNNPIHVTPPNSHDRCAARLTFQRHKSKRFLNAWMNKEVGGSIVTGEINRVCAVRDPRDISDAALQLLHLVPLRSVANNQQMKFIVTPLTQKLEGPK